MASSRAVRQFVGGGVMALLALTACSGSSVGGQVDTRAGPQVPVQAAQALRKCMTEAGFSQFEAGTVGAPGQDPIWDDAKFSAAYRRCEVESGILKFAPKEKDDHVDVKAVNKQNVALVSCIRSRGWKVDDPQQGENGALIPRFPQLSTTEEQTAFGRDLQACGRKVGIAVEDAGSSQRDGAPGGGPQSHSPSSGR